MSSSNRKYRDFTLISSNGKSTILYILFLFNSIIIYMILEISAFELGLIISLAFRSLKRCPPVVARFMFSLSFFLSILLSLAKQQSKTPKQMALVEDV